MMLFCMFGVMFLSHFLISLFFFAGVVFLLFAGYTVEFTLSALTLYESSSWQYKYIVHCCSLLSWAL